MVRQGRIFRVEVDRVTLPTGHTLDMEVMRHPGSVVLLPMPSPGQVILIRQYRYTMDRYIWELPAGSLKPGEDPDAAAARECEEEIGLRPGRIERLQALLSDARVLRRADDLLPLHRTRSAAARFDRAEGRGRGHRAAHVHAGRGTRPDCGSGEIVDLKTVAGLTLL